MFKALSSDEEEEQEGGAQEEAREQEGQAKDGRSRSRRQAAEEQADGHGAGDHRDSRWEAPPAEDPGQDAKEDRCGTYRCSCRIVGEYGDGRCSMCGRAYRGGERHPPEDSPIVIRETEEWVDDNGVARLRKWWRRQMPEDSQEEKEASLAPEASGGRSGSGAEVRGNEAAGRRSEASHKKAQGSQRRVEAQYCARCNCVGAPDCTECPMCSQPYDSPAPGRRRKQGGRPGPSAGQGGRGSEGRAPGAQGPEAGEDEEEWLRYQKEWPRHELEDLEKGQQIVSGRTGLPEAGSSSLGVEPNFALNEARVRYVCYQGRVDGGDRRLPGEIWEEVLEERRHPNPNVEASIRMNMQLLAQVLQGGEESQEAHGQLKRGGEEGGIRPGSEAHRSTGSDGGSSSQARPVGSEAGKAGAAGGQGPSDGEARVQGQDEPPGQEMKVSRQMWAEVEAAARFRLYNARIKDRDVADWKQVWDGVMQERSHPDLEAEQLARSIMQAQVKLAHAAKVAEEQRRAAPGGGAQEGEGEARRWEWHGGTEANWRQCRGTPCASRAASSEESSSEEEVEEGGPLEGPGGARLQERLEAAAQEQRQAASATQATGRSSGEDPLAVADRLIAEHEAAARRGGTEVHPRRQGQQGGWRRSASRDAARQGPQWAGW